MVYIKQNVIEVKNIGKEFNGVWVLKDIDFDLKPGEIHALVGENGAGKSTFIKILSGVYSQSSGDIYLNGKPIKFSSVKHSESSGIRTVHQEINLVPYFKVYENIFIGSELEKSVAGIKIIDSKEMKKRAIEVINRLGVELDVNHITAGINTAMKKIVEICKVLVYNPEIVIFDEPTTALGQEERKSLLNIIKLLKEQGISIIYVSHNLEEIKEIADRVTVFRDGEKVALLQDDEITIDNIICNMLGNKTYNSYTRQNSYIQEEEVLKLEGVTTDLLKNINFCLKKGEILGIAGVVGAGKTEIAKAIFGLDKIKAGSIEVKGKKTTPTPENAIKNKIALVPEERQLQGIISSFPVSKNVTLTYLEKWTKKGILNTSNEFKSTLNYIDRLSIKTQGPEQLVKYLSGGNQQKVVLSRWLVGDFEIGVFDEPTKGIDIKAKEDIYALMDKLSKQGKSIIIMSSYLPELISNCDNIIVMKEGEIVGEFNTRQENLEEKICKVMLGGHKDDKEQRIA